MAAKNEAEQLMEQSLREHGITWRYELEVAGKRPEYWLDLPS